MSRSSNLTLFSVCVLIWGTTWYAITAQLPVLPPAFGVGVRFTLAAALLMVWCRWQGLSLALDASTHRLVAVQGLTGFCGSYVCVYLAEQHLVSGVVAVGYAAIPLVAMVAARVFEGTPMSRRVALGGVVGLLGVTAIFAHELSRLSASPAVLAAAGITLLGVLLSAGSTVAAVRYQRRGVLGWVPMAWAMGWGGVASLLLGLVLGRPWGWSWSPAFLGSLVYLSVVGSVLAFGAYYALIHRAGPAKAGMVGVATPVVALAVSSAFEGFAWTPWTVAGVLLALAGNVVALKR